MTSRVQSATSTRSTGTSGSYDNVTKRYNHPSAFMPAGRRIIYTGPDSNELFHRMDIADKGRYVGIAPLSGEVTSEADYLYRSCTNKAPLCRWRQDRVGEIGWNVPKLLKNSVLPRKIEEGRR